ncbi:MAG TPA: valine--tRNA ligase [Candidatus Paceibacterota bacterium]
MEPRYEHTSVEEKIYKKWIESGFFNPDNLPKENKKPFTIIMPPPNANGRLHAGHALFITLEDIIIRYKRMRGFKTLWVPGADHAGFETQIVYEKKLEKEGRSRFSSKGGSASGGKMSPDELFKEIMAFTLENKKYMEDDIKRIGASCDWSREKFTLDPDVIEKTQKTFIKMHKDGLVYRGKRTINWCPKHQTSLSDVETENREEKAKLYYFKYGPFEIATARPETKFGDKYVVVHPDDKRYARWKHGDKLTVEWINGPIEATVIKDSAIDMAFGTGAMTITPWHSQVDFEIAEKHKLDIEQIIDWRGKLLPIAKEFAGMRIEEAREKIVEKLKEKGLLIKIDEGYSHIIKRCYKCANLIEPQIKDQWFVKMEPLAKLALKTVDDKKIKFIPENYEKIFRYWMENTIDWNISRQIVWGIKIPAWFHEPKCIPRKDHETQVIKCKDIIVSLNKPECEFCDAEFIQDPDTFDTWFSSGQWPLLALGYPENNDFKNFYPTDVMETGYDLIFKWVPRMVIFGLYLENKTPFHTVYLHGLINDAQGKKMSKSKGNVVSPIDLVDKYGADALRMALIVGNTPGTDLALSEDKIKGYRNFSTKLWNIARFILTNRDETSIKPKFTEEDIKNKKELIEIKDQVAKFMDDYDFNQSPNAIYHYVWHTFADKIIESYKPRLKSADLGNKKAAEETLLYILKESLKILHPFMPFITEEIWGMLPNNKNLLMIENW